MKNASGCSNVEFKFVKFDIEDEDPTDDYSHDGNPYCEFDSVEVAWLNEEKRRSTTGHLCHLVDKNRSHYRGSSDLKDYDGNNPLELGYYDWTQVC